MKRSDDVFFFTLIDFLIQVFFFGLLLFVVNQAAIAKKEPQRGQEAQMLDDLMKKAGVLNITELQDYLRQEAQMLDDLMKKAGVSNITELQDYLSKLAPLKSLQGTADFINRFGGIEKAKEAMAIVDEAGGVEQVKVKVKKYDEAYGLPPCLKDEVNGKMVPRVVAVLRVEDTAIEILRITPDFIKLLVDAGVSPAGPSRMGLEEFKSRFAPLRARFPSCAHFVEVKEATQFIRPWRAVWAANFRVK